MRRGSNGDEFKTTAQVLRLIFVLVSGGPCGGKTTICRDLVPFLEEDGFRVFIVPEAATIIFRSGWRIEDQADLEGSFALHKTLLR